MGDKVKLLICDDSILARNQMKDIVLSHGQYEILEAKNGREAIDLYKENTPAIVFCDIVMPEVNGIDVVKEIKEYDVNAKIVMASSLGNNKHLKAALEAGAIDFIQKPVDASRVLEILNNNI